MEKTSDVGAKLTFDGSTPVPENVVVTMPPVPLFPMEICPVRVPDCVGVNSILIVQFPAAANVLPQVEVTIL